MQLYDYFFIRRELSDDSTEKLSFFDKLYGKREHDAAQALLITIAACVKAGDILTEDSKTLKNLLLNSGDLHQVRCKMAELKESAFMLKVYKLNYISAHCLYWVYVKC